ncbi:hypothetical protein, partial [Leptospira santarosai]|uniref:hypothetical protein n=1 Tax=Leptospira santarosai TaxID=28183 RepID=UPI0024AFA5EC
MGRSIGEGSHLKHWQLSLLTNNSKRKNDVLRQLPTPNALSIKANLPKPAFGRDSKRISKQIVCSPDSFL